MNPTGHAAIITGGGSGLGAATAVRLASSGVKVAIVDINIDVAKEVAGRCGGIAIQCDVSDAPSGSAAVAEARARNGAARILVNCAGIGLARRIVGKEGPMALEDYSRVIPV